MAKFTSLLAHLPDSHREIRMSAHGHVLWVCWHEELPAAVNQTLQTYGGMRIVSDHEQAMWFFFTDDAFLALARLTVWSKMNNMAVCIELMPGRLSIDDKRGIKASVEAALQVQDMVVGDSLEIWIHPKSREGKNALPGITFSKAKKRQGMSPVEWAQMEVDIRMPYTSSQSWYAIVHPLGSPLDRDYQENWNVMYRHLEALLQKHKIKFIIQEGYVCIHLENLSILRTFMRDYMRSFDKEGELASQGAYWPCVFVIADRNNFNFTADLPRRIGLQWEKLAPDFPYISYRNAYLIGSDFTVRDISFSSEHNSIDSWCNVLLADNTMNMHSIPLLTSSSLAASTVEQGCFYCGLQTHSSSECPTRHYEQSEDDIWDRIATISLEKLNESFRRIETAISKSGTAGLEDIMNANGDAPALMTAIFDLNNASQLRNVPRQWLYSREADHIPGHSPPLTTAGPGGTTTEEIITRDESPAWDLLEELVHLDPQHFNEFEKNLSQITGRHQRDPRLKTVLGFLQVERGNYDAAIAAFREASSMSTSVALQAWNEYLMGRALEEQGHLPKALEQYRQVLKIMPQWLDMHYREVVCKVRMGFTEQVLDQIHDLIKKDPHYFNKILIDPALERGRILILSALFETWEQARLRAEQEHILLNNLIERLDNWFPEDHPVQIQLGRRVRQMQQRTNVENYLAFLRVCEERPMFERELDDSIRREVESLRDRFRGYLEVLQDIRDEASWFPFPQALKDFSNEFNECAGIINWAFACNFNDASTFQRAEAATPKINELLRSLRRRLKMLRVVRDITLFALSTIKSFVWMELIGLLICFIAVPLVVVFGEQIHLGWLRRLIGENQWQVIKVLMFIVTVLSIGISAFLSTVTFEKRRDKLLSEARSQRERIQQMRLEKVKRQRQVMDDNAKRAQEAERRRQLIAEMRGGA